jgi:hypothetical protein
LQIVQLLSKFRDLTLQSFQVVLSESMGDLVKIRSETVIAIASKLGNLMERNPFGNNLSVETVSYKNEKTI